MGEALPEVKCMIYQHINKVLSTVCKDMKYPSPLYGFYYPKRCMYGNGSYVHDPHPAICGFNNSSQEMKCSYTGTPSNLKEYKEWFMQVSATSALLFFLIISKVICKLVSRILYDGKI